MSHSTDVSEMSAKLQLMIGTDSHLDPAELDPLIMFVSLEVMRNATRAGLGDDALHVVSVLLMIWNNQLRDDPDNGAWVKTTSDHLADLSGWSTTRILTALRTLSAHVIVDDQALFGEGDLEIGLTPLLDAEGGDFGAVLTRYWAATYVSRLRREVQEAEETVEDALKRAEGMPDAGSRLTKLQARWEAYLDQRRLVAEDAFGAAVANLADYVDEVSALEALFDAAVGLTYPAQHTPRTFAQEHRLLPCTRLQALAISASSAIVPEENGLDHVAWH